MVIPDTINFHTSPPRLLQRGLILCLNSTPCRPHPRPRHTAWSLRLLLPLYFPPSSAHVRPLLGFLASQCGSAAYYNFQNQHFSTAGIDRGDDVRARHRRIGRNGADCVGSELVDCWDDDRVEWRKLCLGQGCCEDTEQETLMG